MAIAYRSGWGLYALNGVVVPRTLVETPSEQLDATLLVKEPNAEIRREIVRKIGIERVCRDLKAKVLHKKTIRIRDREHPYELLQLDIGEGRKWKYLKMVNPSIGVYHIEGLQGNPKTVDEALHERKPDWMKAIPISDDGLDYYQQGDVFIVPKGAKSLKRYPAQLS